jgi:hypothetical protein
VVPRLAAAGYYRSQSRPAVPAGRSIQSLGPLATSMAPVVSQFDERDLLAAARECLDLFAAGQFEEAFDRFGHSMAYQYPGASGGKSIQLAIDCSRPGSRVTDWREATGGRGETLLYSLVRYASNSPGLLAAFSVDLPLDGVFSEVAADFVVTPCTNGYEVSLEHIYSNAVSEA